MRTIELKKDEAGLFFLQKTEDGFVSRLSLLNRKEYLCSKRDTVLIYAALNSHLITNEEAEGLLNYPVSKRKDPSVTMELPEYRRYTCSGCGKVIDILNWREHICRR